MRTKDFEFKKTRKVVETFNGLSVDLTLQEAADLKAILGKVGGTSLARRELFDPLYHVLRAFLERHDPEAKVKPRCVIGVSDPSLYPR